MPPATASRHREEERKRQAFLAALDAALTPERFGHITGLVVEALLPGEHQAIEAALRDSWSCSPGDALASPRNPFVPLAVGVLNSDALGSLAAHVHPDDMLCFALSCRAFRDAVKQALGPQGALKTWEGALCASLSRMAWACSCLTLETSVRWSRGEYILDDAAWAAEAGSVQTLGFLHAKGVDVTEIVDEDFGHTLGFYGARGGHVHVLQWLADQGLVVAEDACNGAASGGHLGVLMWLQGQGCPWNADTCSTAARNGHLEVLKWARSQGCPWYKSDCLHYAEAIEHVDMAGWIRAQED